ncbi:MAG: endonuclease/exonuclease/phosphatase family protein [Prevotellaceae bacterium]|jgi:endonuclease/exonuclease/phosphatase family metal-dependent hydrolase|nr:endonuclease/exonuclease/phosphatase family protein [Prevotellaceae bacterium]
MLYVILPSVALPVGFILWSIATEYRPKAVELIEENHNTQKVMNEFTISIWNIGYAGMNAEMDYFLDGGAQNCTTKEQTQSNLQNIITTLNSLSTDFFLLQEVDERSKRSYHIDEFQQIADYLPSYHLSKAYNFKVSYVPVPLTNPIGKVRAGLATLSGVKPSKVERYSYPNGKPWPVSLFHLKRCFMASKFKSLNNSSLYVINTHNSAFDNREQRKKEMEYLRSVVENFYRQGAYVIVGGDWNQVPPDYPTEPATRQYTPNRMSQELLPGGWQVAYDKSAESVRFANEPYMKGHTLTATVDYFLVSPNVEVLEVGTRELNFQNSDHNPISARFRLKE